MLILATLGTTELHIRTLKDEFNYMTKNVLAVTTLGYEQNNLPVIAMVIIEINCVKPNHATKLCEARRPNLPNKEPENTVAENA